MTPAEKYIETLKNKKVAFVGMGVANTPCAEFLAKHGVEVYACDKRDKDYIGKEVCDKLEALGVKFSLAKTILISFPGWTSFSALTEYSLSRIRGSANASAAVRLLQRKWRYSLNTAPVKSLL